MDHETDIIRDHALSVCRNRGILIPTLEQQRNPETLPASVLSRLDRVDLQTVDPINLFRITWKNASDGRFGPVNVMEIPSALSGVKARIVGLLGCFFPTGAHKVGAAFGCLVPRLVHGEFDPTCHRAVWPSTGNYCRGGVFDSALLGCKTIAILPEEMSQERFRWLESMGAETIATPGCESNVKEIFDKCHELVATRPDVFIFNQFSEFGNYLWHWGVTGPAVADAFHALAGTRKRLTGWISATGSGGTLAAGDFLKERFPGCLLTAAEALQCPTLMATGFGGHRIEGIGDKHVPWIHNVRHTDMVTAIDDEDTMRLLRLFNEPAGWQVLKEIGLDDAFIEQLPLLGISSICNLLSAIKMAKYYELGEEDVLFTSFTDSAAMYETRVEEMREALGPYSELQAHIDLQRRLYGQTTDHLKELRYTERKAIHNLKYFTWVEQQGKTVEELNALWCPSFWEDLQAQLPEWDQAIAAFNRDSGMADA